jgi:hypothetical protein
MIVPCDTNVTVSVTFGGIRLFISPKTYIMGPVTTSTCMGGFGAVNTGEQNPFDRTNHESHAQQDFG